MSPLRFIVILLAFVCTTVPAVADVSRDPKTAPYGLYKIDPDHTSVTFKINHLGFSHFTGRFDHIEGYMNFNNNEPDQSTVDVTVYPNSINVNNQNLEGELRGDKWFNVMQFPRATFHATKLNRTGPMTGKMVGDFTLMGVKRSLALDVTFVGTGVNPYSQRQILGFSAVTSFDRSDYGISNMLPAMGNEVVLEIEAEFVKAE